MRFKMNMCYDLNLVKKGRGRGFIEKRFKESVLSLPNIDVL